MGMHPLNDGVFDPPTSLTIDMEYPGALSNAQTVRAGLVQR